MHSKPVEVTINNTLGQAEKHPELHFKAGFKLHTKCLHKQHQFYIGVKMILMKT